MTEGTNSTLTSNERNVLDLAKNLQGELHVYCKGAAGSGDNFYARTFANLADRADELVKLLESAPETCDVPVSPHMPKRERPQKAPDKSGAQYIRELVTYCGLTQAAILGIAYSQELEFLLEQLANAKDDALRLHHAYVDLKFPDMTRPSEKASEPRLATDEIRDLACCDTFVRESASEFCATCGYTNLDHLRRRAENGESIR